MKEYNKRLEKLFRAVANQERVYILELLKKHPLTPSDLELKLKLSYRATFNHIEKLHEAGFLEKRREHNAVYYYINKDLSKEAKTILKLIKQ